MKNKNSAMNENIAPPFLKKNDKIGLAAPARKIDKEALQPAIEMLESWDLQVVLASNIFLEDHQYAGTDAQRIQGFQQLLDDDSIRAILCVRGGYGTVRIIDALNFEKFEQNPKWIAGYSDVTVLHSHLHQMNYQSLHCTMPINFPTNSDEALQSLKQVMFGNPLQYKMAAHPMNRGGQTSGILVGGNLSILYALSASVSDVDTENKILFIEDLEEYLYHIDRMMWQLKRAGKLANLAGLIVGGMNNMNDNTVPFGKTAYEIIAEAVSQYNYPVVFDFPAGHIIDNCALILGSETILNVSKYGVELSFI